MDITNIIIQLKKKQTYKNYFRIKTINCKFIFLNIHYTQICHIANNHRFEPFLIDKKNIEIYVIPIFFENFTSFILL